jgi:hypothetical protein
VSVNKKAAVPAVSTKVLMPFLNDNHLTFLRQFLGPRQLLDLEALRLPKNNSALLTVAFADMDVNGGVIVAVKEESKIHPSRKLLASIQATVGDRRKAILILPSKLRCQSQWRRSVHER